MLDRPPDLAKQFDRIADEYERPPYPEWVFDRLVARCGLGPRTRVLEVGAGSGQATLPMLQRGARVTAVEPGASLAHRLMERTAGLDIDVVVGRLEDIDVTEASFDLAASATAFHWVDPSIGLPRCARALRDSGWLALWWTVWGDPDRPDPFQDALQPILQTKAPGLLDNQHGARAYILDLAARTAEVGRVGAFGPVEHQVHRWEGRHDPRATRRLYATFAAWIALEEPLRSELLGDVERLARRKFGGVVHRPYQTVLYMAERLPR